MPVDAWLKKIKEILEKHKGKIIQISAGEIGLQIGVNDDATHVQVRSLILQVIGFRQLCEDVQGSELKIDDDALRFLNDIYLDSRYSADLGQLPISRSSRQNSTIWI